MKLAWFAWSRHIEYVKLFAHFCDAATRRLSDRDALYRIWADSGDEDVVYDSEFDGDEYCDELENSGEYISAEE